MEKPFYFGPETAPLFGVLHLPEDAPATTALLLVHAFGEEKLWSHRIFVNMARASQDAGIAVLRFDFRGHGDSSGECADTTLQSYLDDIDTALDYLRTQCPEVKDISALGLRFGASLLLKRAAIKNGLKRLILWEPVLDGERYMQELLRINLSTQLAVYGSVKTNREQLVEKMRCGEPANVDGYLVSGALYDDVSALSLTEPGLADPETPALVMQIAPNIKQKDRPELVALADGLAGGEFLKVEEPPFWREIKPFNSRSRQLIDATCNWLEASR